MRLAGFVVAAILHAGVVPALAREPALPAAPDAAIPIVVAREPAPARQRLDQNVVDVAKAFEQAGVPFDAAEQAALAAAAALPDDLALGAVQKILDRHAIVFVDLNDEAWLTLTAASKDSADRPLVQGVWRTYLVKVQNQSRVTSPFELSSQQAIGGGTSSASAQAASSGTCQPEPHGWSQWFRLRLLGADAKLPILSGKEVDYYVLQMCSLDAGDRAAELTFFLGGGQVSQGHYGTIALFFRPTEQTKANK